ncbi:MAG: hypothetical protein PHC66_04510 [Candidatus Nanoarchaeia archaeon]|nr:hypothetical protein [Candidatus Nanoarchaeia archaeon]MDD5239779.1 hypothetical protein [Candidatus Nanoarchaeia archaeon]
MDGVEREYINSIKDVLESPGLKDYYSLLESSVNAFQKFRTKNPAIPLKGIDKDIETINAWGKDWDQKIKEARENGCNQDELDDMRKKFRNRPTADIYKTDISEADIDEIDYLYDNAKDFGAIICCRTDAITSLENMIGPERIEQLDKTNEHVFEYHNLKRCVDAKERLCLTLRVSLETRQDLSAVYEKSKQDPQERLDAEKNEKAHAAEETAAYIR